MRELGRWVALGGVVLLAGVACTTEENGSDPGTGGSAAASGGADTTSSTGGSSSSTSTSSGMGGQGGVDVPPGKVPMFVAQGHMGMTVVSCDDGQTWVGHRTFETESHALVCGSNQTVRCFDDDPSDPGCSYIHEGQCVVDPNDCDCDHHPGSGKGIAYGDGAFVATFGWGSAGLVLRSTDGFSWNEVQSGDTWADVAAGDGIIALSGRTPLVSTDAGQTFTPGGAANHNPWNVRRLFFLPTSGSFLQSASSGANRDILISDDGLATWRAPSDLPAECAVVQSVVEAGGTIIINSGESYVCRSTDNGDTFTRVDLPNAPDLFSGPIHDGTQFIVWGNQSGAKAYTSSEGTTWTETDTNLGGERFGEVARNPVTGVMVAARAQWRQWYESLRWYRSTDGITWETLSPAAGPQTHPVREMTFGWADPSVDCPAD